MAAGSARLGGDPPLAAGLGFAAGAGVESRWLGVGAGFAVGAVAVARGRVLGGGRRPGASGWARLRDATVAAGAAAVSLRIWPPARREPAEAGAVPRGRSAEPLPDGTGLTVVVNAAAGSAGGDLVDRLRAGLPGADVVELGESEQLDVALRRVAGGGRALGVAGGDGSINTAAGVAYDAGKPLVVVPAGTLNHLARDLGVASVDDAVAAVRGGRAVGLDVAEIAGRPFLNTASFGGYAELVDARRRLEARIGKWPALVVALVRVLRTGEPVEVELDGRPRRIWMVFVGNCCYRPAGFAPTWRDRLDDGLLDVRLVSAGRPWSRMRLVAAVLSGTLARCRVYEAWTASELRVRSRQGPLRLARDGETFDGPVEFTVVKRPRPLPVYTPGGD